MRSWMIGMVAGILPVAVLPALPSRLLLYLAGLAGLVLLRSGGRRRLLSGWLVGLAWAGLYGHGLLEARLSPLCNGEVMVLGGTVIGLPTSNVGPAGDPRQRFRFRVDDWQRADTRRCGRPRDLLLSYYGDQRFLPGERWQLSVALRYPWGLANPGSYNRQSWYAQLGVDAVGNVRRGGLVRRHESGGLSTLHHRWRYRLHERLEQAVPEPRARALLLALAIGDKSAISVRQWDLLRTLGVNHLVVISGLHIGLAAGSGFLLGTLISRLIGSGAGTVGASLAILVATAYALLSGMGLSASRALLMLYCVALASVLRQRPQPWSGYLLALCVVLCWQPLAPLNSGFWLSFGAVAALLWLGQWRAAVRGWRLAVTAHAYLALVMVPPGLALFGGASLLTFAANLVLVPLVSLVVVPAVLLCCLLSLAWAGPDLLAWQLLAQPLEYLLRAAHQLPPVLLTQGWWQARATPLALGLALLALFLLVPAGLRGLPRLLPLLCLPILAGVPDPDSPQLFKVHVLDVGQGTAVLMQAGRHALLYDTGGGDPAAYTIARSVVLPFLREHGIGRLEQLIVSHPDRDHSAGVATLARTLPIGEVFAGGPLPDHPAERSCIAGHSWHWRTPQGQSLARFRFLAPLPGEVLNSNNRSCVLQVEVGGYRLLLPGDIDARRERALVQYWRKALHSDWLLVGHHGSATSSSWAWLRSVQPRQAVFSHAYANAFGHPHPGVVERLRWHGAELYSTARGGALSFSIRAGRLQEVRRWRAARRRYWHGEVGTGQTRLDSITM